MSEKKKVQMVIIPCADGKFIVVPKEQGNKPKVKPIKKIAG